MHQASPQGRGVRASPPFPRVSTKSSNRLKYTTKMYNCCINVLIRLKLYNLLLKNMDTRRPRFSALMFGLVLCGLSSPASSQSLEIRRIRRDCPMLRNGVPLVVDGSPVRIAGAEFRFRISPLGPDSLIRATHDGRIFTAVGSCEPDDSGGFLCELIDTAGNPQIYRLSASADAVGVWACAGRHSEPTFLLEKVE